MIVFVMRILALAVLLGAVESTPIPRDPKPDFSAMSFLLGTWNCTIDSARRPRPFSATETTSISTDGYWMVTRTVTPPVPWNPITITATEYVTYDATRRQWIDMLMDDYGAYDMSASPGWSGNSIVWTEVAYPQLHGASTNHPRTFTKISDTKTVAEQPFNEASGRLVSVKTTCTKGRSG